MNIQLPWTYNTQEKIYRVLRFMGLLGFLPLILYGLPNDDLQRSLVALSLTMAIVSLLFILVLDLPDVSFSFKQPSRQEVKE